MDKILTWLANGTRASYRSEMRREGAPAVVLTGGDFGLLNA
jgi:hypothetical protein